MAKAGKGEGEHGMGSAVKPDRPWEGGLNALLQSLWQVRRDPRPLVILVAVYMAVFVVVALLSRFIGNLQLANSVRLIAPLIVLGLAIPTYALAVADKRRISVHDCFNAYADRYPAVLMVTIGSFLAVAVAAFPFVVPVVWVLPWVSMAMFYATATSESVTGSFRASYTATRQHKRYVWGVAACLAAGLLAASFIFNIVLRAVPDGGPAITVRLVAEAILATFSIVMTAAMARLFRWLQR